MDSQSSSSSQQPIQQSQSQQSTKPPKKYIKLQKIAQGTYGIVWKAKNKETLQIVAIKKFKNISNQGLPVSAVREVHILKKLSNVQWVMQPIQLKVGPGSISMFMEWKQLTLLKMIKQKIPFSTKTIFKQLIRAMAAIHSNYILHRDMKPANIVLDNPFPPHNLKIIDFGMSKQQKFSKSPQTNQVGTLYYRAPQLLLGTCRYGPEIDIWPLGCILYEMLVGTPMFKGDDEISQVRTIYADVWDGGDMVEGMDGVQGEGVLGGIERNDWGRIKQELGEKLGNYEKEIDLLRKILMINPKKRPTCQLILKHEYLKQM